MSKLEKGKQYFIDLFAGCGGLSLGLSTAGWTGLFAVEKDAMAFKTLRTNLVDGPRSVFHWPAWLPKKESSVAVLLKNYPDKLKSLRGKVSLIAGGPPCQGFSMAGRRKATDPRNRLVHDYLKVIDLVRPDFLLLENVRGFTIPFRDQSPDANARKSANKSASEVVVQKLSKLGYAVGSRLLNCSDFGVPQRRERFILIAIRKDCPYYRRLRGDSPFDSLETFRSTFLKSKRLPIGKPVTASQAISDLEIGANKLIPYEGSGGNRFKRIEYLRQSGSSAYVKLMRKGLNGSTPSDLRLPNHKPATISKFSTILRVADRGVAINSKLRDKLGSKKLIVTPLSPSRPSVTVTTLPDDILHYLEPRILTVREMARLQSFPDWFEFSGNYTTGGKRRGRECPRYTQVGNAVPPLLAEALGRLLLDLRRVGVR